VGSDAAALARHALALLEGLELQWLRDPSRNWVEDWDRVAAGIPEFCEESSMQQRRGADGGAKA
jgi:hypothetical protein